MPPIITITEHLADEQATLALGARLGAVIEPGMTIYLCGELGAGKTTVARGLVRALGHTGKVKSPTYTLVELYGFSRLNLYHFDLFRFRHAREWLDAGLDECFNAGSVCLVEWPEKAADLVPPPDVRIELKPAAGGRDVILQAHSEKGRRCLERMCGKSD